MLFHYNAWVKKSKKIMAVVAIDFITDSVHLTDGFVDGTFAMEEVELLPISGLEDAEGKVIKHKDVLKRTVTVVLYGTNTKPKDVDEYLLVEYREEYGGFFIGERPAFDYINTTHDVDTGCRCTKAINVGSTFEYPELLEVK